MAENARQRLGSAGSGERHFALAHAAQHGHAAIVRLLAERGARRDLRDAVFRGTPADWAEHAGRTALAACLRS
jgi:ankyrin repeat protein